MWDLVFAVCLASQRHIASQKRLTVAVDLLQAAL
jgi:hypothetical protein